MVYWSQVLSKSWKLLSIVMLNSPVTLIFPYSSYLNLENALFTEVYAIFLKKDVSTRSKEKNGGESEKRRHTDRQTDLTLNQSRKYKKHDTSHTIMQRELW